MSTKIKCPTCKGKSTIELSVTLQETLDYVRKHPGVSAADIWRESKTPLTATAFNRRLDSLLALGLVRRKGLDEKTWGWWVV